MKSWLIYGANGYSGRLIAKEAKLRGLVPTLAGRNLDEITALGKELGLPTKIFPCVDPDEIAQKISSYDLVMHCAGPFSATSRPMVQACMKAKSHYLDITGEIGVFEKIMSKSEEIKKSGIIVIPGVGFDVVPTDCLAHLLKDKMPDATELDIILKTSGGISPGTMKTMVEGFYVGTVNRENGIIKMKNRFTVKKVSFFKKSQRLAIGIPWGDISTAFHTTQIPNINVFLIVPWKSIVLLNIVQKFKFLFHMPKIQKMLKNLIEKKHMGPSKNLRDSHKYRIWGEVRNSSGQSMQMGVTTPNGYDFTADSAIEAVLQVLEKELAPGAYTPSLAFQPQFLKKLKNVEIHY